MPNTREKFRIKIRGQLYQLAPNDFVRLVYDKFEEHISETHFQITTQKYLFQILVDSYVNELHLKKDISAKTVGRALKRHLKDLSSANARYKTERSELTRKNIKALKASLNYLYENGIIEKPLFIKSVYLSRLPGRKAEGRKRTYVFLIQYRSKYSSSPVQNQVDRIISEKTALFVGRDNEFQRLDHYINENPSGYILVTADAGLGKTSFLANWLSLKKDKKCFTAYHFFSSQHPLTNSTTQCYRSLLHQLQHHYRLEDHVLPHDEDVLSEALYNTIAEEVPKQNHPLYIVVDALDEADRHFIPPFPTPLPHGIYVIASARAHENEQPEYLKAWTDARLRVHLKELPLSTVADWLRQAGEGQLSTFADDQSFISQLHETTEGFPLFLAPLIDEMIHTASSKDEVYAVLNLTPRGLDSYIREQLNLMAKEERLRSHRDLQRLFAILSVALGPLSQDDIQELTQLTVFDLEVLPWQVRRWFIIQTVESDKVFYSFIHPQLAKEFEKALGNLGREAKQSLIHYCSRWAEHKSVYALRYYPQHLYEANTCEPLFDIARNNDFLLALHEVFPEDPNLILKPLDLALKAALHFDNGSVMAELLLQHAHHHTKSTQRSPLQLLRQGSLTKAQSLADFFDLPSRLFWYLLLAWELKDNKKVTEAKKILTQLLDLDFSLISDLSHHVIDLIFYLNDLDENLLTIFENLSIDDYDIDEVSHHLISRGLHSQALSLTSRLKSDFTRTDLISQIAISQAQSGDILAALKTIQLIDTDYKISEVLETLLTLIDDSYGTSRSDTLIDQILQSTNRIKIEWIRSEIQSEVIKVQARLGSLSYAEETLNLIPDNKYKVKGLLYVALNYFSNNQTDKAMKLLRDAISVSNGIEKGSDRVEAISSIFVQQQKMGLTKDSKTTFLNSIDLSEGMTNLYDKSMAFYHISIAQSSLGNSSDARTLLQRAVEISCTIDDASMKNYLLEIFAKNSFELDFALDIAQLIDDQYSPYSDRIYQFVSKALLNTGQYAKAKETALKIQNDFDQSRCFLSFAEKLIADGDIGGSRQIASEIKREHFRKNAFGKVLQAYARAGDLVSLNEIVQEFDSLVYIGKFITAVAYDDVNPEILNELRSILSTLFLRDHHDDQIPLALAKISLLNSVAYYFAHSQRQQISKDTFSLAIDLASRVDHLFTRATCLTEISFYLKEANLLELSKMVWDEVISLIKKDIFALIHIPKRFPWNDTERLKTILSLALSEIDKISDLQMRVRKYLDIADMLYLTNNSDHLTPILKKAIETVSLIDESNYSASTLEDLLLVARHQCKAGMISEAKKTISEVIQKEDKIGLNIHWKKIAEALAATDDIASALRAGEKEEESGWGPFKQIAIRQAEKGEVDNALVTLERIEDKYDRDLVFEAIADSLINANNLSSALNISNRITDENIKTIVLLSIFDKHFDNEHFDHALEVLNMISLDLEQNLITLAHRFAKIGSKEGFKKVLVKCSLKESLAYSIIDPLTDLYPEAGEPFAHYLLNRLSS